MVPIWWGMHGVCVCSEFGEVDPELLNAAVTRFTRSCAGYSVATYVLVSVMTSSPGHVMLM